METIPGHREIRLIPAGQHQAAGVRRRLQRDYRRAVVLRAELLGVALLRPTTYAVERHEGMRFMELRADLAIDSIVLGSGATPFPAQHPSLTDSEMVLALTRVIGEIEQRFCPGPDGAAVTLLGAYIPRL